MSAGQIVSVCQAVTVNPLGSLSDRACNGHVLSQAGSDPQLAVVGELDLAVLPPATFSKSHNELRFLLSITLEQECLRRWVPGAVSPVTPLAVMIFRCLISS